MVDISRTVAIVERRTLLVKQRLPSSTWNIIIIIIGYLHTKERERSSSSPHSTLVWPPYLPVHMCVGNWTTAASEYIWSSNVGTYYCEGALVVVVVVVCRETLLGHSGARSTTTLHGGWSSSRIQIVEIVCRCYIGRTDGTHVDVVAHTIQAPTRAEATDAPGARIAGGGG